jgi:TonB family protein
VGGGITAPKLIDRIDPAYTEEARKAKLQGVVVLWCVITKEGEVRDLKVQRSLDPGLDEQAVAAVKQWKFQPATKDGVPVPVMINVEVNFRLR